MACVISRIAEVHFMMLQWTSFSMGQGRLNCFTAIYYIPFASQVGLGQLQPLFLAEWLKDIAIRAVSIDKFANFWDDFPRKLRFLFGAFPLKKIPYFPENHPWLPWLRSRPIGQCGFSISLRALHWHDVFAGVPRDEGSTKMSSDRAPFFGHAKNKVWVPQWSMNSDDYMNLYVISDIIWYYYMILYDIVCVNMLQCLIHPNSLPKMQHDFQEPRSGSLDKWLVRLGLSVFWRIRLGQLNIIELVT